MRELVLKMSISVDGFVGGPGNESGWLFRSSTEDSAAWVLRTLEGAGVHALGSRSYRELAGYWPTATGPMAAAMNDIAKVVFTRQRPFVRPAAQDGPPAEERSAAAAGWASAQIADGDLVEEVRRLKEEPGGYILAHGGATFARSLVRLGLVDEYRLVTCPVALGTGLPLFTELPRPLDLQLVSATRFRGGIVANVYRPADPG